jgi:phage tail-like protein
MPGAARFDPIVGNYFFFEFGGHQVATLSEISGIEDESDVVEVTQQTKNGKFVVIKTLGAMPLKGGKLTLKYPAIKGDPVKTWYDEIVNQKVATARTNCSVILYDFAHAPVLTFNFKNAWPSKYSFSSLSTKGNDALSVTVTIEHTGMDITGYNS